MRKLKRKYTTYAACKLDVKDLPVPDGCKFISWQSNTSIVIDRGLNSVMLHNIKTDKRQTVQLSAIPSNLGKGELTYFLCPVTGKRCKVLYYFPAIGAFISREAFKGQLYYPLQTCSKTDRPIIQYFCLAKKLENVKSKRAAHVYAGKITKRWFYTIHTGIKVNEANYRRFGIIESQLQRLKAG